MILPLDIIFKLVNSSADMPYIKFNPGKYKENIYRLYTNQEATNGKKVPFLKRLEITKIDNKVINDASITYVLYNSETHKIIIQIFTNGNTNIHILNKELVDIPQIIELMHTRVNSLLNKIQKLLENQGYNFSLFRSFDDNKIRYNYMEYNSNISITKKLRLKKFIGCLSSIVNIVDEILK